MAEPLPAPVGTAVRTVAGQLGLDHGGPRPLRIHDAATVLLPRAHVVVRLVPLAEEAVERARRAVQLTQWLSSEGFPTIRPAAPDIVELDGYVASVWHEVATRPAGSRIETNAVLGQLLRELHGLPRPPLELPPANPLRRLRAALRLDAARSQPVLDRGDTLFLEGRMAELAARYATMSFPLGSGLIHNDAHPGNMIPDPETRYGYVLTDWEGACNGPRELDVVLVGAPGSRFGDLDSEREAFSAGYGYDIGTWPGYQVLRDIRDLHSLAAFIRAGTRSTAALAELGVRVASIRDGDRTIRWTAG